VTFLRTFKLYISRHRLFAPRSFYTPHFCFCYPRKDLPRVVLLPTRFGYSPIRSSKDSDETNGSLCKTCEYCGETSSHAPGRQAVWNSTAVAITMLNVALFTISSGLFLPWRSQRPLPNAELRRTSTYSMKNVKSMSLAIKKCSLTTFSPYRPYPPHARPRAGAQQNPGNDISRETWCLDRTRAPQIQLPARSGTNGIWLASFP
jgi:hypothetical protein